MERALKAWGRYERDRDYLSEYEENDARAMFKALARLPPDEQKLLAAKYHSGNQSREKDRNGRSILDKPVPDKDLCKRYGLTTAQYQHKRIQAEHHFDDYYNRFYIQYLHTKRKELQDYALAVGSDLYFERRRGYPFFDILLTYMPEQAAHLHGDDELARHDGFRKLSLDELKARINGSK